LKVSGFSSSIVKEQSLNPVDDPSTRFEFSISCRIHCATVYVKVAGPAHLARRAKAVVDALDPRGAWVEKGKLRNHGGVSEVIEMTTLIRNIEVLAQFVGAVRD